MFEAALRLLQPVMPSLTEELWQRLAKGAKTRPLSIALAKYPEPASAWQDAAAEREIGLLQGIVTGARTLRAKMKLDPKVQVEGVLYSRNGVLEIARAHTEAIRRLAGVGLDLRADATPQGAPAIHSTAEFDLVLNVPRANVEEQRKRLEKEREQLEKNIANSNRQLEDEKFLSRAPAHVVQSIRTKLVDYETQLQKVRQALNGLAA